MGYFTWHNIILNSSTQTTCLSVRFVCYAICALMFLVSFSTMAADLSISLNADKKNYQINEPLTYTLKIQNTSSKRISLLSIQQKFISLQTLAMNGINSSVFTKVSISALKINETSQVGDFSTDGDLNVSNALIAPNDSLTYLIKTHLANNIVGDITLNIQIKTSNIETISATLTTTSESSDLQIITHKFKEKTPYIINQSRRILFSIINKGKGIAYQHQIEHNIALLITEIANDFNSNNNSSTDFTGAPFMTWVASVNNIGSNSKSELATSGPSTNKKFNDKVSVYPGEKIDYLILATISPISIGNIKDISASINDAQGVRLTTVKINASLKAKSVFDTSAVEIKIRKSTTQNTYLPGEEIVYTISVKNSSALYFANNIELTDKISCIKTLQSNLNTRESAFKNWRLDVISGNDNQGSRVGLFNYGSSQTGDLNIIVDIAPGKEIQYKLTTTVLDTSIGLIIDNDLTCKDNIIEKGIGLQMPRYNLSLNKEINLDKYTAGSTLTYKITIGNTGDGLAYKIRVVDTLSKIMVKDISDKLIPAFDSWEINASSIRFDGSPTQTSFTGVNKLVDDLDVFATLDAHSKITYLIKAHVIPTAIGPIINTVKIDNSLIANRRVLARKSKLNFTSKTWINGTPNLNNRLYYSKEAVNVTYQLLIENQKNAGFASNIRFIDKLKDIRAELLHPKSLKPVFSKWTISAQVEIIDPSKLSSLQQQKIKKATKVGNFMDNKNIDVILQIPPNIRIIYTINATIDRTNEKEIRWGEFTHSATLRNSAQAENKSISATIYPKLPHLHVIKKTNTQNFNIGQKVTFNIIIFNTGKGYANDVEVHDVINALAIFEPNWIISAKTDNAPTGSNFDTTSTLKIGKDINTIIDIDPDGSVTYQITGTVKNNPITNNIINTVKIYDPINNTKYSASASLGKKNDKEKLNISITKTADLIKMRAGEDLTYKITISNNSNTVTEDNLTLTDMLADIKGVLANNKDTTYADAGDQSPFEYWQIKLPSESTYGKKNTDNFIYPPLGATYTLSLQPNQSKVFSIKIHVKDNFVGIIDNNVLNDIVTNRTLIYKNYQQDTQSFQSASHQIKLASHNLFVQRTLKINAKSSISYLPGDTLTYEVVFTSAMAYSNDIHITEKIRDARVLLMDGTSGHPFKNKFTVKVTKNDTHGGAGTTDGVSDGIVKDNQNIDTHIDIAMKDSVTYRVTGMIRNDAVGEIKFGGLILDPVTPHLVFFKNTKEKNHQPGKPLNYTLTVKNTSSGNAYNIPIIDKISTIKVTLMDGTKGPAFEPKWVITTKIIEDKNNSNSNAGNTVNGKDINTHFSLAGKSTLTYSISATVNPKAIGKILNLLIVDSNTVSNESMPGTQRFFYEKKIVAYYEADGKTKLSTGLKGYKANGYIEYEILIKNQKNIHLKHISIKDEISKVTTTCYNIKTGKTYQCMAFDAWEIRSELDDSRLSNAGSISNDNDINTYFNLAASEASNTGSFIKYIIKAHIKENAVGKFSNSVTIKNRYRSKSAQSSMLASNISKLHKAYTDNTLKTVKTIYDHTSKGQKVVYHLRLENKGDGLEYGHALQEKFSKILIKLAQVKANQIDHLMAPVYLNWTLKVSTSKESMTSIGKFIGGNNRDIDIAYLSIAPGGWIDFVMESQIRPDSIGKIAITPVYADKKFSISNVDQISRNLSISKTILSIGKRIYSAKNNYYLPGDTVEYQIIIKNTKAIWYNNALIKDILSAVKVEIVGDNKGSAFSEINITNIITDNLNGRIDTLALNYSSNKDLNLNSNNGIDIAPLETLVFNIKAKIRIDALGTITKNTAYTGSNSVTEKALSPPIPPVPSSVTFETTLISSIANQSTDCILPSTTGKGCHYSPERQVTYQIKVENTGLSIAHDVHIKDLISEIKTSKKIKAFALQNVHIIKQPNANRFSIRGSYQGTNDLNAYFDLMPNDHVTFEIVAKVSALASGDILNTAIINNKTSNTIILKAGKSTFFALKEANISRYRPGQEIVYSINIFNTSQANADVRIVDFISKFLVKTANGSEKTALKNWKIVSKIIQDGATDPNDSYTDISKLPTSGDINSVISLSASHNKKKTHIEIKITGTIRSDALGKFTNTVIIDGTIYRLNKGYILPSLGQLQVTKKISKNINTYVPGESIGFDVQVSNIGDGYLHNVKISDLINDITSDFAGESLPGKVFQQWDTPIISILGIQPELSQVVDNPIMSDSAGYIIHYNIAPQHKVNFHFEAKVNDKTMGNIINRVSVTDNKNTTVTASAEYIPEKASLTVLKTVDKDKYESNDTLTYTITIKNTTKAWAKKTHIVDRFSLLKTTNIYGVNSRVFDAHSIKVQASSSSGRTILALNNNTDIDAFIDIAPLDSITIVVSANLLDKVYGNIISQVNVTLNSVLISARAKSIASVPGLTFTKTTLNPTYTAGEISTYLLTIKNDNNNYATDIKLVDIISKLTVKTLAGSEEIAFEKWTITTHFKHKNTRFTAFEANNADLKTTIILAPLDSITFTIKGQVNTNAMREILNIASIEFNGKKTIKSAELKASPVILSVAKTADKKAYTNDDTQVIYTLKVYNRGSSDVDNVLFEDKITQLQGSHGKPLFTDWISTIKEMPSGVIIATQKNNDLSSTQTLKAYAENSFVITIVGTIAKGLDNDITNIFTARTPNGEKSSTSVRIHVKKYTDNEGQLLVYKRALKNSIKVGEVVEYEVIIENHNESEFRNIILEDRYPAGFKYVPDSVEMTHSGSDGTFDTHDDTITSAEPSVSNVLSFKIGDLLINNYQDKNVHEKIRIRYLLRASLGTTFGKYINTAYALAFLPTRSSGTRQIVSNLSSATVSITADKFFDTASIIGKVFEDHNQDGYQADATATNIRIHVDLMPSIYIQGSTTITHNNQERKSNSILDGIKIKKLMGLSLNRTLLESNKAILKFSSLTLQSFAFTITTDAGSHISFSKDNQIKVAHRGKKVKGLSAERLNVTRTLYQDGQTYLWEIVVENIGIYEDGIPGIKLLTVDGIIIETDEYGRYHLPDQWVLNKKGKQTLIKLDSDSLPAGMHVISENPKVLRISPYKLTKFNFSVHLKINRGLEK